MKTTANGWQARQASLARPARQGARNTPADTLRPGCQGPNAAEPRKPPPMRRCPLQSPPALQRASQTPNASGSCDLPAGGNAVCCMWGEWREHCRPQTNKQTHKRALEQRTKEIKTTQRSSKQTNKQRNKRTNNEIIRRPQTERQTDRHTNKQTNRTTPQAARTTAELVTFALM